ncbi:MAG: transposase [Candidatus Brockarchaeota archaeon]|nr:transposase [Candidatus Brockarchaeota archaeon]MBO3809564.1 transposase [Candidatus Brockarchaeota archaeon]
MSSPEYIIARKTIKAKILKLSEEEEELLRQEYENFQRYLRGEKTVPLYAATKQQADRFLRRINGKLKEMEYPLMLRNDTYSIRIERSPYILKIPIHGVWGGIRVPIKTHEPITGNMRLREAKVIRRGNEWFVHICVEKKVEERIPKNILAIDMGIRWIATTVNSSNPIPKFYGKELRRVKGHFFYLRRSLALKKAYGAIKKIGDRERRIVNDILHKISREIVNEALKTDAMIALGDLKGIRKSDKGNRFNRKLNGFPYYKLSKLIEYKARWLGIKVIKVNERNTSKLCHRCGSKGIRKGSLFECPSCNYTCNADYNGAVNIMKRAIRYMRMAGAGLTQPITR